MTDRLGSDRMEYICMVGRCSSLFQGKAGPPDGMLDIVLVNMKVVGDNMANDENHCFSVNGRR